MMPDCDARGGVYTDVQYQQQRLEAVFLLSFSVLGWSVSNHAHEAAGVMHCSWQSASGDSSMLTSLVCNNTQHTM
jgi:hypothetical protein